MNKREAEKKLLQILKDGAVTIRPAQLTELYELVDKLVEKPEPVKVSEEEARCLDACKDTEASAAGLIRGYFGANGSSFRWNKDDEDRLMRAYVLGWTVKKPKRWNVKVPHVAGYYYEIQRGGDLDITTTLDDDPDYNTRLTQAEIDHYGLRECQKIEVNDDGKN